MACHEFSSLTKLTAIPCRPKRPVRPVQREVNRLCTLSDLGAENGFGDRLTNSVEVSLGIDPVHTPLSQCRQIIVDDHGDLTDVDSSSDDVRGDQDFGVTLPETVDGAVTIAGIFATMKGRDRMTLCDHTIRNVIGGISSLQVGSALSV